MMIVTIKVIAP
ncbi:Protein of unknown function [Lactobacillus delbrueckii subsp. lactis]|nr:Protein of unknown function [Lactobacillus delbrueckii subsp. lactis]